MPFDGDPQKYETREVQLANAVIARLQNPANWCHIGGWGANGARCILGTIGHLGGGLNDLTEKVIEATERAARELFPKRTHPVCGVPGFNDARSTTHADVMRVLHRARELLSSQSR